MSATATYDLHLHTYWSHDASAAPENHLERASQLGVRYMAITEHDNLDSLDELLQAAGRCPEVQVIPSAELTVSTSIGDIDLLCHGFPISNPPELQSLIQMYAQMRLDTARAVAQGLAELGCDFDEERQTELAKSYRPAHVLDKQGPSQVHGPVLRGYLLKTGAIVDEDEFSELRARAKKIADAPSYPAIDQVVPVAKQLGVVVSIAHPTKSSISNAWMPFGRKSVLTASSAPIRQYRTRSLHATETTVSSMDWSRPPVQTATRRLISRPNSPRTADLTNGWRSFPSVCRGSQTDHLVRVASDI